MTQFEMADTKAYFTDDGKVIGQPAKSPMKYDLASAFSNGVKISSIKMILKNSLIERESKKGKNASTLSQNLFLKMLVKNFVVPGNI
jgi:hypothetical protein